MLVVAPVLPPLTYGQATSPHLLRILVPTMMHMTQCVYICHIPEDFTFFSQVPIRIFKKL